MKVLSGLVGAAASAIGSPVERRALRGVLICTGPNATGTCTHQVYALGRCHQLAAPLYHNVDTFAPDADGFSCFPSVTNCGDICTSPTGCTFGAVDATYPNRFNLSTIGWKTLFSSFDGVANRT